VVEFVAGKNQTDPRDAHIQSPWTPAMSLLDAVGKVTELLVEQQEKIEAEQIALEGKRLDKLRMEQEVERRVKEQLETERAKGGGGDVEEGGVEATDRRNPQSPGVHNPLQAPPAPGTPSPRLFEAENDDEEGSPVVRLGKSMALARHGSFRHSISKQQGIAMQSGLDVKKLLGEDMEFVDSDM
jgi:hypothetical protein